MCKLKEIFLTILGGGAIQFGKNESNGKKLLRMIYVVTKLPDITLQVNFVLFVSSTGMQAP